MATTKETNQTSREAPQEPAGFEASSPAFAPTRLIDQLAEHGFGVADDFVDAQLLAGLRARCLKLNAAGDLRPAKVGLGANARLAPEVRGDFISWLAAPQADAEQRLLAKLEVLRAELNRGLMAGLEDFQGHFALYPRGTAYARHFDRLVGSDLRAISAALYLNEDWQPEHGGNLRIYIGGGRSEDVMPQGGRLVVFLSDRFEHEVLPATRERLSFTGWFRRRALEGFG